MNMSRSRRKTSISGNAKSNSEKQDKREYNRRYRRVFRQKLLINPFKDTFPHLREYSNLWSMSKDGKRWFDAKKYPKLMRK